MSHRPAPADARRWLIVPSTIGCLVACGWLPAAAQPMTTTVTQPFLGVTHTHIETTNPRLLDMHLVTVDLSVPGIGFAVTPSNGAATGETVGRTTRQFLGDQKVQLAINGGFSAWVSGSNYDVQGLAASRGGVYSSFEQYRTFALDISADNVATILRSPSGTGTAHYPDIPLYNTLPGEARLLRDGAIVAPTANETLHPRTAVGLSGDQRTLYLFTVDGRNNGHSLGVTRPELADFMRMFGATDAINLDGGGSTTLVFADPLTRVVNVPVGMNDVPGTERVVGSNFGVFALPMPSPAAVTVNVASGMQTQWQAGQPLIVNALSLTKSGGGTLVLDQANTFTGPTTLTAGTVRLAHARGLAASPVTVRPGTTLTADPDVTPSIPSVALTGGTLDISDLTIGGTAGVGAVTVSSGSIAATAGISLLAGGRLSLPVTGRSDFSFASLTIDESPTGGLLDIGTSVVTVPSGGMTGDELVADIVAGRGDGSGNGTVGIASSAARGDLRVGWLTAGDGSLSFALAAAGDVTLDGVVDVLDAATLLSAGRYDSGLAADWADGDFNHDSVFDIIDATDMLSTGLFDTGNYLPAATDLAPVPEPSGLYSLIGFAAVWTVSLQRWQAERRRHHPRVHV
jgi:autotransporter-associated beta strand protein